MGSLTDKCADELALEALQKGQTLVMRASTRSMLPTIEPGDRLLVRGERVEVGDIALVRLNAAWVTHRVAVVGPRQLLLRADSGGGEHEVSLDALAGRVIAVQRRWGGKRLRRLTSRLLRALRRWQ